MAYEDVIAQVDLFSRLAKDDLARIAKAVVPRTYPPGDQIVKEGDQAVAFYIITKGKVDVRKGEKSVNTLGAGESFGEMALLDGYPRSTSVFALEDTECLAMTRWDFTAELNTNPSIAVAMLPILSKRIRELMGQEVH
jgi:CRP-like cAMP-binding protein